MFLILSALVVLDFKFPEDSFSSVSFILKSSENVTIRDLRRLFFALVMVVFEVFLD